MNESQQRCLQALKEAQIAMVSAADALMAVDKSEYKLKAGEVYGAILLIREWREEIEKEI